MQKKKYFAENHFHILTLRCSTKFSFHHTLKDAGLLLINMAYRSCGLVAKRLET